MSTAEKRAVVAEKRRLEMAYQCEKVKADRDFMATKVLFLEERLEREKAQMRYKVMERVMAGMNNVLESVQHSFDMVENTNRNCAGDEHYATVSSDAGGNAGDKKDIKSSEGVVREEVRV